MELELENKISIGQNNRTAILLDHTYTYSMPIEWMRIIKWLRTATSKDEQRPLLHCIHSKENYLETTDGFRIHRVTFKSSNARLFPEGLIELRLVTGRSVVFEIEEDDSLFPKVSALWKEKPQAIKPKLPIVDGYIAYVHISPSLLASALSLPETRNTVIEIGTGPFIIKIPPEDGRYNEIGVESIQAMIMPVFPGNEERGASGLEPAGNGMVQRNR